MTSSSTSRSSKSTIFPLSKPFADMLTSSMISIQHSELGFWRCREAVQQTAQGGLRARSGNLDPWSRKSSMRTLSGFSEPGGQGVADEHTTAREREPHASSSSSKDASSPSSNAESSIGSDQGVSSDQSLAQSILFMRDTMVSHDASHAVASGDVGRLWEDMKVSIAHLLNMWSSFSRLCSLGSVGTDNMHNWVTDDDIQLCWL